MDAEKQSKDSKIAVEKTLKGIETRPISRVPFSIVLIFSKNKMAGLENWYSACKRGPAGPPSPSDATAPAPKGDI